MKFKKEDVSKKVGTRIREIRISKNLSMEKLATDTGIEYSQLSRIELGKINTSIYHVYIISQSLNVPVQDLFEPVQK
jgi:transcriptional regulator with XRE-family HTH domain